jgi:hyperosmotically inducible periplasmic protein
MSFRKHLTICTLAGFALMSSVSAFAQTSASAPGAAAAPATKNEARKQNYRLETKVRHTLDKTRHLDASNITIVARGGKITLEGDAPDDQQIQLAGSAARQVAGVTGVTNNLRVRNVGGD